MNPRHRLLLLLLTFSALAGGQALGEDAPGPAPISAAALAPAAAPAATPAPAPAAPSVWSWLHDQGVFLKNWQWFALLGILLVGMALGRVVRYMLAASLRRWVRKREEKEKTPLPEKVVANAEKPFGWVITAVVFMISLPSLGLPAQAGAVLDVAAKFCLAAAGCWALFRTTDFASALFEQLAAKTETKLDDILVPMVRRTIKVFVTVFGLVFIAQNLNIQVTSLLAGLGLGGLAFALAAKDTVANFFGSIMILIDQPFRIGDWVVIAGAEGTVEDVGFRTTRIRTFYNSVITLPNSSVVNMQVDNYGMRTYRRCKCMISLTYDTPPEKVEAFCEGVRELVRLHPYMRKDYYHVYFNAFAASSLDILLYVFWKVPDWGTELRERQRLFVDIMRLARSLGVEFAFPTQTLHIKSLPQPAAIRVLEEPDAETGKPAAVEKAPTLPAPLPPLLTGDDLEKALEAGRQSARELVKATLGDPVKVPPPVTY